MPSYITERMVRQELDAERQATHALIADMRVWLDDTTADLTAWLQELEAEEAAEKR